MTTRQFQESSALRIFLSYFKPHRKLFFLDMCCALMIAVIDLAFPYVSRWCMYQLLPESAYRTFFAVMAVVFCSIHRCGRCCTYIICYYGHTFGILVEADIRRDLFRHMQELSFDYYDRNRTGQLMSRLTADLFDITELAHHGPEDIFISGVTIVGALAIMFTIQWQLALVIACIIPVFFLVVWTCRKSMQDASDQGEAADGRHQRRHRVGPLGHQVPPRPLPMRRRSWRSSTCPTTASRPPSGRSTGPWAGSTR